MGYFLFSCFSRVSAHLDTPKKLAFIRSGWSSDSQLRKCVIERCLDIVDGSDRLQTFVRLNLVIASLKIYFVRVLRVLLSQHIVDRRVMGTRVS